MARAADPFKTLPRVGFLAEIGGPWQPRAKAYLGIHERIRHDRDRPCALPFDD
ncbi:hypothetical protein STVA_10870 [Allostella vacuolata]|nr:hypothetical protein STVA_10870 [Stella vacuolata]